MIVISTFYQNLTLGCDVIDDAEVNDRFDDEEEIEYFNNKNIHTVGKTNLIVIY